VEAQRKVNKEMLQKLESVLIKKTGLSDLKEVDKYVEDLDKELNIKRDLLAESLALLEAELTEVMSNEPSDDLEEELDGI